MDFFNRCGPGHDAGGASAVESRGRRSVLKMGGVRNTRKTADSCDPGISGKRELL